MIDDDRWAKRVVTQLMMKRSVNNIQLTKRVRPNKEGGENQGRLHGAAHSVLVVACGGTRGWWCGERWLLLMGESEADTLSCFHVSCRVCTVFRT